MIDEAGMVESGRHNELEPTAIRQLFGLRIAARDLREEHFVGILASRPEPSLFYPQRYPQFASLPRVGR